MTDNLYGLYMFEQMDYTTQNGDDLVYSSVGILIFFV